MKDKASWVIGGSLIVVAVVAGLVVRFSTAKADEPRPTPPPTPTTSAHALGAAPTLAPLHASFALATVSCR